MNDEHCDLMFSYTRAEAIADGFLIDVSRLAKEAGFRYLVAVTAAVWNECIVVPVDASSRDETGRLWDIPNVLRFAIRSAKQADGLGFAVYVRNNLGLAANVQLQAVCGPGDGAAPVITIMLPDEK